MRILPPCPVSSRPKEEKMSTVNPYRGASGLKIALALTAIVLLPGCPWLISLPSENSTDLDSPWPNQKTFDSTSVQVTTLIGNTLPSSPNASSTTIDFFSPKGVASDGTSTFASFADSTIKELKPGQHRILAGQAEHIPYQGFQGGFADGQGEKARFHGPSSILLLEQGDLIVADTFNHRIRKVTRQGFVSTLAGTGKVGSRDGQASEAEFNHPSTLAVDPRGNLYVGEEGGHRIRRLSPEGQVSTVAGTGEAGFVDGAASQAQFNTPLGLAVDPQGNLFVADTRNYRIRRISPEGIVSTVAGSGSEGFSDGPAAKARFTFVSGLAFDSQGSLFIADLGADCIRKLDTNGQVTTLVGGGDRHLQHSQFNELNEAGYVDGDNRQARFKSPADLAFDPLGNLWVADLGNNAIRKITFAK